VLASVRQDRLHVIEFSRLKFYTGQLSRAHHLAADPVRAALVIGAAVAVLAMGSPSAFAGPCDVSGAIPNCEAILSGAMPMPAYRDDAKPSSFWNGRPSTAAPYAGHLLDSVGSKLEMLNQQYSDQQDRALSRLKVKVQQ
jgi:hypothetical protein